MPLLGGSNAGRARSIGSSRPPLAVSSILCQTNPYFQNTPTAAPACSMPADEHVPLEPWQRNFEGAFKQMVAQSMAINELLYKKLFFQSGYAEPEAWQLAPFMEVTGLSNLRT